MNILIIGYGRMGRLIERTALDQGDAISGTVDIGNLGDLAALGRTAEALGLAGKTKEEVISLMTA